MVTIKKITVKIVQMSFLYKLGPMIVLRVAQGEKISKEKRPTGSGRVGKKLGSDLPNPLAYFSASSLGTASNDNMT